MRLIAAALAFSAVAGAAAAADIVVQIDQSARLPLRGSAASVFVGNPSVADASIIDRNNLVVVGRGYGVTNLMVVDGAGRTILNRQVRVSGSDSGRMTLFRAAVPSNYTCSPSCERTPMPGEPDATFSPYNGPYQTYQGRAAAKAGAE